MKKSVCVLLSLLLLSSIFSFNACTGGGTENAGVNGKTYRLKETASNGEVEVSVLSLDFADTYNSQTPGAGRTFAVIKFSVKNIGKTKINGFIYVPTGDSYGVKHICYMPVVDYNNGYLYHFTTEGFTFEQEQYTDSYDVILGDLEPLSNAVICESAISVPQEVKTNSTAPLSIKLSVPYAAKDGELVYDPPYITFKIR